MLFTGLLMVAMLHASECAFVRLDTFGGSMGHVPVENQRGLDTCTAHVATQMVEAWTGPRQTTISAIETSLGTKLSVDPEATLPGRNSVCEAVNYMRRAGVCDENSIAPAFRRERPFDEAVRYLSAYFRMFRELGANDIGEDVVVNSVLDFLKYDLQVAPRFVLRRERVLELLRQPHAMVFMTGVIAPGCRRDSRIVSSIHACVDQNASVGGEKAILAAIHARLSRKRPQPIAITYCAGVLTEGSTSGSASACLRHASLVIGRRLRRGRCEFLVRNSWGKTCERYSSEWPCETGDVWIGDQTLAGNISQISYLE